MSNCSTRPRAQRGSSRGGFSAAGRRLNLSNATVSDQIPALKTRLDRSSVERGGSAQRRHYRRREGCVSVRFRAIMLVAARL
jgi:hypothetical protein